jgi:hypothetical protein
MHEYRTLLRPTGLSVQKAAIEDAAWSDRL